MNRRISALLPLALAASLLAVPSFAFGQEALDGPAPLVELPPVTPGGGRFITPVAVPDTYDLNGDEGALADSIAATIRRCLRISGYFDVYGPDRYFFDPANDGMTAATINFQNWYNVQAQAVVKTAFRIAGNQISVDFRLFDVDNQAELNIGYTGGVVPRDRIMHEVYEFVNLIIAHYTGQKGIFGSRIAFIGRDRSNMKQVFVMTMDGEGGSQVTNNGSINLLPRFGPGGEIMYTSYVNGNPDLFIGRNNARVFSSRPGINSGPAYHAGRGEIAMTMTLHGNSEIYIVDTEGQILRRCTENTAEDVSPTWSPDGSEIAFVSDRSGGPQIYVMSADCSGQRRVTFAGAYNTEPSWSPLGDRIVFTGRADRGRFDIFTVEPGSGYIERLTQDQGDNEHATWSPDGRYLVFVTTRGGAGGAIYVMTEDGQSQTEILSGNYESPMWER